MNPPRQPYGEKEKGRISLAGATVSKENCDGRLGVNMNRIYISGKNAEDLLLEADTEVAADAWFKEINRHIEFADENPHLVNTDENDAQFIANNQQDGNGRKSSEVGSPSFFFRKSSNH
eukprot:TRINITY_DN70506_c0_g1_i1.p1 TRINITY_DN70506_c0_g1~~TRINITY_DN70506_c0_g1_i1.p1  ORF type:complete len:119 (-),score=16.65 TRINITY_DN70506_c0_g1_i1:7-363(-)